MITYAEYVHFRDRKGLKDSDVARLAGISPATLSEWKRGGYTPKYEKITKIEQVLGIVSLYTEDNYVVTDPEPAAPIFSDIEVRIIDAYRNADPVTQANILKLLDVKGDSESGAVGRSVG